MMVPEGFCRHILAVTISAVIACSAHGACAGDSTLERRFFISQDKMTFSRAGSMLIVPSRHNASHWLSRNPGGAEQGRVKPRRSNDMLLAQTSCRSHRDCDDGLFCNGSESCDRGRCERGVPVNCDDRLSCTSDRCAEDTQSCTHSAPDADGDGHSDSNCIDATGAALGDDCDDADNRRFPGNPEVCDPGGHDEDCDRSTFGNRDADGDRFVDQACFN